MNLPETIRTYGSLVRFSHSLFALPFAIIIGAVLATRQSVSVSQVFLLLLCCITARTAAMAWNRYLDRDIDAVNERTKQREIPRGVVSCLPTRIFLRQFSGSAADWRRWVGRKS